MIYKYSVEINGRKHPFLVEEKKFEYDAKGISTPGKIVEMMNKLFHFSNMAEEYVYMIAFSSAMEVLGVFQIAHGNICSSVISPKEIILRILISGASGAVVLHNHPSGSVIPSANDLQVFRQLKNSFSLFNIDLLSLMIAFGMFIITLLAYIDRNNKRKL